jgi:hypothetical protein
VRGDGGEFASFRLYLGAVCSGRVVHQ